MTRPFIFWASFTHQYGWRQNAEAVLSVCTDALSAACWLGPAEGEDGLAAPDCFYVQKNLVGINWTNKLHFPLELNYHHMPWSLNANGNRTHKAETVFVCGVKLWAHWAVSALMNLIESSFLVLEFLRHTVRIRTWMTTGKRTLSIE